MIENHDSSCTVNEGPGFQALRKALPHAPLAIMCSPRLLTPAYGGGFPSTSARMVGELRASGCGLAHSTRSCCVRCQPLRSRAGCCQVAVLSRTAWRQRHAVRFRCRATQNRPARQSTGVSSALTGSDNHAASLPAVRQCSPSSSSICDHLHLSLLHCSEAQQRAA